MAGDGQLDRRTVLIGGLVILACLVVYANALPNPFLFDDQDVIQDSRRVTGGELGRLWTEGYWERGHTDLLYRPLVSVSYGVQWAWSHEPWTFRLVNLALHALVSLLVLGFTGEAFTQRRAGPAALVAALVFAVHPIHTEPLNPIVGRADLAATLFAFAAVWIGWRDGDPRAEDSRIRPAAAALCLLAALLCKESGVAAIGILLLLDVWRGAGVGGWARRARRCYAPLLAAFVGYLLLREAVLGQLTSGADIRWFENPAMTPLDRLAEGDVPFLVRWATPLAAFTRALQLLVVPTSLTHDTSYPAFPAVARFDDPRLLYGVAAVVLLGGAALLAYRRKRTVLVAIGIAVIPYLVVSSWIVPIGTVFGERLLYMPSVGACIAFGLLLGPSLSARGALRVVAGALVGVVVLAFGWMTIDRNRDWRSAEALILSVGDGDRASYRVLDAFADRELVAGLTLERAGDEEGARVAFERARGYAERAAAAVPEAWGPVSRLAEVQLRLGQDEQALATFTRALDMGAGLHARTLHHAALLASRFGRYADTVTYLELYLEAQPRLAARDRAGTHVALAMARMQPGPQYDPLDAADQARAALATSPELPAAHRVLAAALLTAGKPAEALPHARLAAASFPTNGRAQLVLVRSLVALDRTTEAVEAARTALDAIPPNDPARRRLEQVGSDYESSHSDESPR